MKYKERDSLVQSLRELADLIEEKGLLLPRLSVSISGAVASYDRKTYEDRKPADIKREVKTIVRALKPVNKKYYGSAFYINKEIGELSISIRSNRESVCKQVKTGNKIVHAAQIIPEYTEEEIEWICTDPLLKAS